MSLVEDSKYIISDLCRKANIDNVPCRSYNDTSFKVPNLVGLKSTNPVVGIDSKYLANISNIPNTLNFYSNGLVSVNTVPNADDAKCCFGEPDYGKMCKSGLNCAKIKGDYCRNPKHAGELRCRKYYVEATPDAISAMKYYCNSEKGISTSFCQSRCREVGGCDDAAKIYCAKPENKANSFCACLLSSSVRPECYDGQCVSYGYKTQEMRSGADCPNLIKCMSTISVYGDQNQISSNQMQQTCIASGGDEKTAAAKLGITLPAESFKSTFEGLSADAIQKKRLQIQSTPIDKDGIITKELRAREKMATSDIGFSKFISWLIFAVISIVFIVFGIKIAGDTKTSEKPSSSNVL